MSMHIVFYARATIFHSHGGMEAVAHALAKEMVAIGHTVEIVTTRSKDGTAERKKDGVIYRFLDCTAGRYSAAWWNASADHFRRFGDKYSLVLGISVSANSVAKLARSRANVSNNKLPRVVAQLHGTTAMEIQSQMKSGGLGWIKAAVLCKNFLNDRLLKHYSRVVVISEVIEDSLKSSQLLRKVPAIEVIPNGVDFEQFRFSSVRRNMVRSSLGIDAREAAVLISCKLIRQKGIFCAIRIFEELQLLRTQPTCLVVCGDGPDREQFSAELRSKFSPNSYRILGAIDRDQMPNMYMAADALLFPSLRREGMAMNVLESLASGLHCFVSPSASIPGIADGQIVIDPQMAKSSASQLASLLSRLPSSDDRDNLLPPHFSQRVVAERYLNLATADTR